MAGQPRKPLTTENFAEAYPALVKVALRAAQQALYRPDEYEDAEEAASDALAALALQVVGGEPVEEPEAFVVHVAKRRAADVVRKKRLRQTLAARHVVGTNANTSEAAAKAREVEQRLRRALDRLPGRQRQCFEWHYLGDMSVEEIAAALQIRVGTVKSHLSRARAAIVQEVV